MKIKTCAAQIKAAGINEGTADGQFNAIVATYDVDSVGDKILPGAFAGTLEDWTKSGDPIPVYWSHRMDDPMMCIGSVLDAKETDQGLEVKAQLDLDNPTAVQVYRLLKGRRVTQFSFAYDVEDGALVDSTSAPSYYELRKLKLYEVGPTPIGANQATELIDVKTSQRHVTVEVRNADRDELAAISLAVKDALGTAAPGDTAPTPPTETDPAGDADPDDSPATLIAAIDAALDEASELFSGADLASLPPDVQQGIALVNGAEAIIDDLLGLLGINDPDDPAEPKQHNDFLAKAGRRNSATDMKDLQAIHDAALSLGATCTPAEDSPGADDTGKSHDAERAIPITSAATEEPDGAKADVPACYGAASIRLRTELGLKEVDFLS